jgi:hypothetical protein
MSRLYLLCGLCGRQQADGLLSRGYWGHLDAGGSALRACPTCKEQHADWESRLRATSDPAASGAYVLPQTGTSHGLI